MNSAKHRLSARRTRFLGVLMAASLGILAGHLYLYGQDQSEFPDGYDAVEAAPHSHRVIFENALVRVLEVTVPPPGETIPMHHHRWPSFFLDWDTGGGTPHIRYHRADGSVREQAGTTRPVHAGVWNVQWMKPEPMHAIEVVDKPKSAATVSDAPTSLRVEIKCPR
jgi:hypothetical protein